MKIRFLCVALFVPILLSDSHLALAQSYGGFGGYGGYGGYGAGYGGYGGYGPYYRGYRRYGLSNYGIGAGSYPGAAFGFSPGYLASRAFTAGGRAGSVTYGTPQPAKTDARSGAVARAAAKADSPGDLVLNGETAFRDGDYWGAIEDWKSALAATPRNPVLVMLLGQAYFAAGSYAEAATTTQEALKALPQDRWAVVIGGRSELYRDAQAYMFQLQQLESTVTERPKDAGLRFLLAFHYACLDYPQPAVAQLDKVLELDPKNELAAQLRKDLTLRLPDSAAPVITPGTVTQPRR